MALLITVAAFLQGSAVAVLTPEHPSPATVTRGDGAQFVEGSSQFAGFDLPRHFASRYPTADQTASWPSSTMPHPQSQTPMPPALSQARHGPGSTGTGQPTTARC